MIDTVLKWVLWNGMLAVIPVVLAYAIGSVAGARLPKAVRWGLVTVLAPVWFFFLPNTCYLLTEWRHYMFEVDAQNMYLQTQMDPGKFIPLFGMSVFYACYSGFGMITFALAVRPIERAAARVGLPIYLWALPFFVAVSLGVYLGLVLRFNTWDLLTRVGHIWAASVDAFSRPMLCMFILAFGAFLWIAYEALDLWIDAASDRWHRLTHGKKQA